MNLVQAAHHVQTALIVGLPEGIAVARLPQIRLVQQPQNIPLICSP